MNLDNVLIVVTAVAFGVIGLWSFYHFGRYRRDPAQTALARILSEHARQERDTGNDGTLAVCEYVAAQPWAGNQDAGYRIMHASSLVAWAHPELEDQTAALARRVANRLGKA